MTLVRVGLTGGIAAGKSTVAGWLREAGFTVVDADKLVAALYLPGGEGSAAVARLLGASFLTPAGQVDHRRLASRVFQDQATREHLESIIHPLVRRDFESIASNATEVVVLEAPLLVEAGLAPDFDLVVTVEASPESRLRRAVARGLSEEEARRRFNAQTDETTRVQAADRVLRNDGSLQELREQVDGLVGEIRRRIADER